MGIIRVNDKTSITANQISITCLFTSYYVNVWISDCADNGSEGIYMAASWVLKTSWLATKYTLAISDLSALQGNSYLM